MFNLYVNCRANSSSNAMVAFKIKDDLNEVDVGDVIYMDELANNYITKNKLEDKFIGWEVGREY